MDAFISIFREPAAREMLLWLAAASGACFVASLIAIPIVLVRLPADYFDTRVPRTWMKHNHPVFKVLGHILKNTFGTVFLIAGILMLFLPGQGLLTMLIGISLLDFPGKRRLEANLIGRPAILTPINRIRSRFHKPPLVLAPAKKRSNISL